MASTNEIYDKFEVILLLLLNYKCLINYVFESKKKIRIQSIHSYLDDEK